MKLCLDTNAYVAFKQNRLELVELLETAEEIIVPSVVLGELYAGFFQGTKIKRNTQELLEFLRLPGVSVINLDHDIAERYGHLVKLLKKSGKPIPTNDVWIAATTFETGSRLVSYDKHFQYVPGLTIYSP